MAEARAANGGEGSWVIQFQAFFSTNILFSLKSIFKKNPPELAQGGASNGGGWEARIIQIDNPGHLSQVPPLEQQGKVKTELRQATRKGDWKTAKRIFKVHPQAIGAAITGSEETALHVAILAGKIKFARQLVVLMDENQLRSMDKDGNTAFLLAASDGQTRLARDMVDKCPDLPAIRGSERRLPIHMAAFEGHRKMVKFLYRKTDLDRNDRMKLLESLIDSDMFDIAMDIIDANGKDDLHILPDRCAETVLSAMARNPRMLSNSIFSFLFSKSVQKKARELFDRICDKMATMDDTEMIALVGDGYSTMFSAVEKGNVEFLRALIDRLPVLAIKTNDDGHTIFHAAVVHRQKEIFDLIHTTGSLKKEIAMIIDKKGNHMLDLAAGLVPAHRLASIPGEALQYQYELLFFRQVERVVGPLLEQTPFEMFIQNHRELLEKAEAWVKYIANSCIVIIGFFASVATLVWKTRAETGGTNQNTTGDPEFSVAIALAFSVVSVVTFFSFHTSAYFPEKFVWEIPSKLLVGLGTLFASMASLVVVAFSSGYTVLMIVFVPLLVLMLVRLNKDILFTIIKSTPFTSYSD